MATALRSGLPHVDYYAPRFRVEIDGEQLSPQTNGDILSLAVKMDLDQMASFDMTVANIATFRSASEVFKYSDGDRFDIGRQVHIKMGYADALLSMIDGQITSVAPKFPQSGPPTLTVSGQDGMFRLKDRRPEEAEQIQVHRSPRLGHRDGHRRPQQPALRGRPVRPGPSRGHPANDRRRHLPQGAGGAHRLRLPHRHRRAERRGHAVFRETHRRARGHADFLCLPLGREPVELHAHHQSVGSGRERDRARLGSGHQGRRSSPGPAPTICRTRQMPARAARKSHSARRPASRTWWSTRR